MDRGYCICCLDELTWLDDDPNGDKNATCQKCRAEEEHDFDADPNALFDKRGFRVDS